MFTPTQAGTLQSSTMQGKNIHIFVILCHQLTLLLGTQYTQGGTYGSPRKKKTNIFEFARPSADIVRYIITLQIVKYIKV